MGWAWLVAEPRLSLCVTQHGALRVEVTTEAGNKSDLSICCIRSRATGYTGAWSVHVAMVPDPGSVPVFLYVLLRVTFYGAGTRISISFLLYCGR